MHFTSSVTHATLNVHRTLSDDAILELVEEIDAHIVSSADPYREDFVVTVWRGEEVGVFGDDDGRGDETDAGDEPADGEEPDEDDEPEG